LKTPALTSRGFLFTTKTFLRFSTR
jgi:hypothetical protein